MSIVKLEGYRLITWKILSKGFFLCGSLGGLTQRNNKRVCQLFCQLFCVVCSFFFFIIMTSLPSSDLPHEKKNCVGKLSFSTTEVKNNESLWDGVYGFNSLCEKIWRCNYKCSTFFWVILKDPKCYFKWVKDPEWVPTGDVPHGSPIINNLNAVMITKHTFSKIWVF